MDLETAFITGRMSLVPTMFFPESPSLPEKDLSLNLAKIELLLVEGPYNLTHSNVEYFQMLQCLSDTLESLMSIVEVHHAFRDDFRTFFITRLEKLLVVLYIEPTIRSIDIHVPPNTSPTDLLDVVLSKAPSNSEMAIYAHSLDIVGALYSPGNYDIPVTVSILQLLNEFKKLSQRLKETRNIIPRLQNGVVAPYDALDTKIKLADNIVCTIVKHCPPGLGMYQYMHALLKSNIDVLRELDILVAHTANVYLHISVTEIEKISEVYLNMALLLEDRWMQKDPHMCKTIIEAGTELFKLHETKPTVIKNSMFLPMFYDVNNYKFHLENQLPKWASTIFGETLELITEAEEDSRIASVPKGTHHNETTPVSPESLQIVEVPTKTSLESVQLKSAPGMRDIIRQKLGLVLGTPKKSHWWLHWKRQ